MPRKSKRTFGYTDDKYVVKFNSEIPSTWRVRNTKWTDLYKGMNTLLDGTNENIRIELTNEFNGDVTSTINSIRGAMYRWAETSSLNTKRFAVRTASGFTEENIPYVVGWIEERKPTLTK